MKKITLYSILMLFTFFSCKQESEKNAKSLTIGKLTISDEHPKPGDNLDLTYNSDNEVDAFYTYMVGDKNYPLDIDFSEKDGEQKASIKVPDSAIALAFVIKVDDKFDDNDKKGYLVPLFNKEGEQIVGSNSATSYYALRYGGGYGIKGDEDATVSAMKADMDANPDLKSYWEVPHLQLLFKNDKEEGKKLIDKYADAVGKKSDASEKDYTSVIQFYSMLKEDAKADSIKKVALAKFPKGNTANYEMVNQFQQERDLDKKAAIFQTYSEANSKLGNIGNYMAGNLAKTYYQQKDMDNFDKYLSKVDDNMTKASTLNNLAWPLAESGKNLDQAEKMSKSSLDFITSSQKNPKDKPETVTKKQYEKNLKAYYDMYADTYALILFKQGKIKEAITYQENSMDPEGKNTEANERYIEFLMTDNQFETAKNKAENFLKWGYGNDKIKEAYKTAYVKVNPSATDVEDNLTAFEKEAYASQVAAIKKTMLDEEAPTFTLKDMQGNDVALASLKGKTVILDFWATWCGPCIASFPGMQEVVTKYKDDDSVVLLFIDTFERGPNRVKLVEDFMKTNSYDFHVVYDAEIDDGTAFEVAGKYDISGIPTKVIIGPDGRLKFKSVGYGGSNEKLVKELDIMIDILKS